MPSMQLVSETRPQVRRDRLIRLAEVKTATGLGKSMIYLLMRQGSFPQCVRLSPRCSRWPESLVLQFVQDRIAASRTNNGQQACLPDAAESTDA